jgi:type I restriction enzyme, R subunit
MHRMLPPPPDGIHISTRPDAVTSTTETLIGLEGMRIDRMFFEKFEDRAKTDPVLQEKIESENWDQAVEYVTTHLFEKPNEYFNLDKLRKAAGVDRRLTLREIPEGGTRTWRSFEGGLHILPRSRCNYCKGHAMLRKR